MTASTGRGPRKSRGTRESRQGRRQVAVLAHAGADEAGLGGDAIAVGGRADASVERVDRVAGQRPVDQRDGVGGDGEVAADHDSRVLGQGREGRLEGFGRHCPHGSIVCGWGGAKVVRLPFAVVHRRVDSCGEDTPEESFLHTGGRTNVQVSGLVMLLPGSFHRSFPQVCTSSLGMFHRVSTRHTQGDIETTEDGSNVS
jgi:hypothetical protein